jgi:hypothetical protein
MALGSTGDQFPFTFTIGLVQSAFDRYANSCANLVDVLEMVRQFILEGSDDYRFIRFWELLLYRNYFPVTALGLPYSRLWAKDRNITQEDAVEGGPIV